MLTLTTGGRSVGTRKCSRYQGFGSLQPPGSSSRVYECSREHRASSAGNRSYIPLQQVASDPSCASLWPWADGATRRQRPYESVPPPAVVVQVSVPLLRSVIH